MRTLVWWELIIWAIVAVIIAIVIIWVLIRWYRPISIPQWPISYRALPDPTTFTSKPVATVASSIITDQMSGPFLIPPPLP